MSTRLRDKYEAILLVLDKLKKASTEGALVIVEGARDSATLRELGIEGQIMTMKTGGRSTVETAFEIQQSGASEVILLLDFDRRGRESTRKLKFYLERQQVTVNLSFWVALSNLIRKDVQCVEGLASLLETLQRKIMHQHQKTQSQLPRD